MVHIAAIINMDVKIFLWLFSISTVCQICFAGSKSEENYNTYDSGSTKYSNKPLSHSSRPYAIQPNIGAWKQRLLYLPASPAINLQYGTQQESLVPPLRHLFPQININSGVKQNYAPSYNEQYMPMKNVDYGPKESYLPPYILQTYPVTSLDVDVQKTYLNSMPIDLDYLIKDRVAMFQKFVYDLNKLVGDLSKFALSFLSIRDSFGKYTRKSLFDPSSVNILHEIFAGAKEILSSIHEVFKNISNDVEKLARYISSKPDFGLGDLLINAANGFVNSISYLPTILLASFKNSSQSQDIPALEGTSFKR